MEALDVARWQFGIMTVYHFIFVPLTIGLSLLVAIMQSIATFSKNPVRADAWTRLTKFFGSLLLVNFGIGVATGIMQEFQFGMNWSEYSKFVGDVFGAPLAFEGLAAFFLESVFFGLWLFGWNHLSRKVHLLTIWCVAIGTCLSAYFIIAANSFMQHPVGSQFNPETGRPELKSFGEVLMNPTTLAAFPHVISGAWLVAAAFVTGVASWHMVEHHRKARKAGLDTVEGEAHDAMSRTIFRPAVRFGVVAMFVAAAVVAFTGDDQARLMFVQQPMKMASAEALCTTTKGAPFSVLVVGGPDAFAANCHDVDHLIEVPHMLSFLADHDFNSTLKGVEELNQDYKEKFGTTAVGTDGKTYEVDYRPNLFVTFWAFRLMVGLAGFSGILAFWALWVTRKKRTTGSGAFKWFAMLSIPAPFLANSAGWIFTEMGRQPWVVVPNPTGDPMIRMLTMQGVSPNPGWMMIVSLASYTVLYSVLIVVWFHLMRKTALEGIPMPVKDEETQELDTPVLSFEY